MPVTSEIDADLGFIHTTCSGKITLDDILKHLASLEKSLKTGPRWCRLIDMRAVELYEMTGKDVSRLAQTAVKAFERMGIVKSAVVAESNLVYGMIRMFEIHLGPDYDGFHVFRNMAQAREWLGVDDASSDLAFG